MTTPVSIGMLSFAHGHANSYAAGLRALPHVRIAGIWDENPDRGQQAAAANDAPWFADADALLTSGLDGVIICSANAHHRSLVLQAAGRTPAILCEKPIATTVADARAMIDACDRAGTRLMVAFPVRYAAPVRHLKALLDQGQLGTVYAAKCTNHGSMPGSWFIDPQLAGGGAVIDHTVHVIDLLRWFWGCEVTEVYAEVGVDLLHPSLGIDDVGLLSFRLSNGVYGTLDTSWSRPPSYPTWGDVKIELVGEKGAVRVDVFRQQLLVACESWHKSRWVNFGSDMDAGLIADFVDMIRTGRAPSVTGIDGLKALEVALAAYASALKGAPVALPAA
jgi:predicted dehydrogenase